jgi:hypothetical protein
MKNMLYRPHLVGSRRKKNDASETNEIFNDSSEASRLARSPASLA